VYQPTVGVAGAAVVAADPNVLPFTGAATGVVAAVAIALLAAGALMRCWAGRAERTAS
jgi:hypothetical protein